MVGLALPVGDVDMVSPVGVVNLASPLGAVKLVVTPEIHLHTQAHG